MAMIVVDGVALHNPSEMTYGLMDVSAANSGRTEDALMWKQRVGQKRKLSCVWSNISPSVVSDILTAVNPEYMDVTYHDAMTNSVQTRNFYVGDRTAMVKWWCGPTGRIYGKVSINFIER